MRLRVGMLYSRFAGMPQAIWGALRDDGHEVVRPEDVGITPPMSANSMVSFAERADADLLVCPFLKEVVPAEVCERWSTWVPHPGVRGDAGPTSLSWAILDDEEIWGLTMVKAEPARAAEELDSGNVGAWREFPMPPDATVAEVYAQHVTRAAVDCTRDIVEQTAADPGFRGTPLAKCGRNVRHRFRPALSQERLAFSWDDHPHYISRRIRAATLGVRSEVAGHSVNVFDAHPDGNVALGEDVAPGEVIAENNGAVLMGTSHRSGVWIGHAKVRRPDGGRGLKLPTATAIDARPAKPERYSLLHRAHGRPSGPHGIRYRRHGQVGWIHAAPYNGAYSTSYCRRMLRALHHAASQETDAIAVTGGLVAWSNGIHLSTIEAAADPQAEAWDNIREIDEVAEFVFGLSRDATGYRPQTTIAVLQGSAGAGGAVLSACFDRVLARSTINLNYHYATMGLTGSELHSVVLPLRAEKTEAKRLLGDCLPITPESAQRLGLVDDVGPSDPSSFVRWSADKVVEISAQPRPRPKRIATARAKAAELEMMRRDIFDDRQGFAGKRRAFLGVD